MQAPWLNFNRQKNKHHISLYHWDQRMGNYIFSEMILQHFYLNFSLGDRGDVSEGKGTNF